MLSLKRNSGREFFSFRPINLTNSSLLFCLENGTIQMFPYFEQEHYALIFGGSGE